MRQVVLVLLIFALSSGCEPTKRPTKQRELVQPGEFELKPLENGEPSHVTVQHVLIAFDGSLPGQHVGRTQSDAKQLASEILERANAGEEFSELVKTYSDDKPPGIYKMANIDQATDMSSENRTLWIRPRTQMAPAFGNVSFGLDVDQVGMTDFNQSSSPFGWHIIKRIR